MAFFSLADIPSLKKGRSRMVSSYDRGRGNRDYLSVDPGSVPGVTEDMIMSARYDELKKLVERYP